MEINKCKRGKKNFMGWLRIGPYIAERLERRACNTQASSSSPSLIERFSYDLEMKTRDQNRNNKRTEIERFDWFIEQIQTNAVFGWLSERSGKKTSFPRTF